ncbi:PDCD7 protein, partial [Atractosteus spatula]|nr:PDCD7 protein [Atractosteus spatula]
MDRPPPFHHFSGRPPQQSLMNPGFSEGAASFSNPRSGSFPRAPHALGYGPSDFEAFQGSGQRNQGTLHSSGVVAGFWSGQNAFRQSQPPPEHITPGNQRFSAVQAEWSAFPPALDSGRQEQTYKHQFSQSQGYSGAAPDLGPRVNDFDPARPPPLPGLAPDHFRSRLEDESKRGAAGGPHTERDYRPQLAFTPRPGHPWQPNPETSHFDRICEDPPHSYSHARPPQTQPGSSLTDTSGLSCQRQNDPQNRLSQNASRPDRNPPGHYSGTQEEQYRSGRDPAVFERDGDGRGWESGYARGFQAPADAESRQRQQDEQWIARFLTKRRNVTKKDPVCAGSGCSVGEVKDVLYSAARLVSDLSLACRLLKENVENESFWSKSYARALEMKAELQKKLHLLTDSARIERVKRKLATISKKRSRQRQKSRERLVEKQEEEARAAEREAAIDKWRMKRIQEVEEKKREQELKAAADSVLSEVRKKQADCKRMVDILRSLEKLRKLRKEAAARKGIYPEKEADEVFEGHLTRLRALIRKRTAVYGAEEKALRVMLEGEQEEERKREQEKRQKKEKEKLLQRKREVEAMLFGESAEMHPEHPLQPFRQYYLQADHSLHALIQIRREWDQYLVPVGHPDGSFVPQGWVLPEPPSDEVWATALVKAD